MKTKVTAEFDANGFPKVLGVLFETIKQYPGHAFGSDGSVWSKIKPGVGNVFRSYWTKLNPTKDDDGYFCMNIRELDEQKSKMRKVHQLILEAFTKTKPLDLQGCHKNGIRTDNRKINLRWGTYQSNVDDKIIHGNQAFGVLVKNSKLNDMKVKQIKKLWKEGKNATFIANQFQVARSLIWSVVNNKRWKHVI